MRRVAQRRFIPDHIENEKQIQSLPSNQRSDCMRAPLSSLFDMDYEDVCDLMESDDDSWLADLQEWLADYGLYCIVVPAADFAPWKGLYLVGGKSPRGRGVTWRSVASARHPIPKGGAGLSKGPAPVR